MIDTINLAIAGLGTVGAETFKILGDYAETLTKRTGKTIKVVAVSARDKKKDRGIDVSNVAWHTNAVELASLVNVDVVVELIGGDSGPAYDLVTEALKNGKHVVTANKALVAKHGFMLAELAEKHKVALQYEAAVAGGIPVIKSIKEGLGGNKISKVSGILNGTCNYILTAMEKDDLAYDDVLAEAQALGYAEADPTFDVGGIDAAHKLAIITALAFGVKPDMDAIYIEGIESISGADIDYAAELGYAIRLFGTTQMTDQGIEQRVHPCLVAQNTPLAAVDGVLNAVQTESHPLNSLFMEGAGAGAGPTASSVLSDIVDIARGNTTYPFGIPAKSLEDANFLPISDHVGEYYIRLLVEDKSGVLADITTSLSKESVGMERVLQKPGTEKGTAYIAITTHEVVESAIASALKAIAEKEYVLEAPHVIRIEES